MVLASITAGLSHIINSANNINSKLLYSLRCNLQVPIIALHAVMQVAYTATDSEN